jgi:hypothetical protein
MSMHDPKVGEPLLYHRFAVAPTVMTSSAEAGDTPQASCDPFPPNDHDDPGCHRIIRAVLRARLTLDAKTIVDTALLHLEDLLSSDNPLDRINNNNGSEFCALKTLTEIKLTFWRSHTWYSQQFLNGTIGRNTSIKNGHRNPKVPKTNNERIR